MKKRILYLPVLAILATSCKTVKEGIITEKWYEEAVSSMSFIMAGKIMAPVYIHDDEDFVVKIEGFNKQGNLKSQNYYVNQVAYDTLCIGDWFCVTNDCFTKDKKIGE